MELLTAELPKLALILVMKLRPAGTRQPGNQSGARLLEP